MNTMSRPGFEIRNGFVLFHHPIEWIVVDAQKTPASMLVFTRNGGTRLAYGLANPIMFDPNQAFLNPRPPDEDE